MSKKIPISFNQVDEKSLACLVEKLNLTDTYGAVPKTLRFSIEVTKKYLDLIDKSIPDLELPELDLLLSSIRKRRELRKSMEIENNLRK